MKRWFGQLDPVDIKVTAWIVGGMVAASAWGVYTDWSLGTFIKGVLALFGLLD